MKKIISFLVLLFISISAIHAQDDKDFPAPGEAEVPGLKILQQKYFDGNALWGHINGGADLYLEYGFDKLLFQEIELNNTKLRVEYYRMNDAAAAFGIFSVSQFKCDIKDSMTKYICITPYQVQTALGRFYISIANTKGSEEAENLSLLLFKIILENTNEKLFDLPEPFNRRSFANYSSGTKLFRGILGIQNALPRWIDLFESFSDYQIIVSHIENNDGYIYFSRVKFISADERIRFIKTLNMDTEAGKSYYRIKREDGFYIVRLISESEIYFYDTSLGDGELNKILDE